MNSFFCWHSCLKIRKFFFVGSEHLYDNVGACPYAPGVSKRVQEFGVLRAIALFVARGVMTQIQEHDFASGRFSLFQEGIANWHMTARDWQHNKLKQGWTSCLRLTVIKILRNAKSAIWLSTVNCAQMACRERDTPSNRVSSSRKSAGAIVMKRRDIISPSGNIAGRTLLTSLNKLSISILQFKCP